MLALCFSSKNKIRCQQFKDRVPEHVTTMCDTLENVGDISGLFSTVGVSKNKWFSRASSGKHLERA